MQKTIINEIYPSSKLFSSMTYQDIGKWGEIKTQKYLTQNGHKIIDCNYHAGRVGEIDIISKFENVYHFTEVKTRRGVKNGNPYEAITKNKIRKLRALITIWLKNHQKIYSYKTVSNNISSITITGKMVKIEFFKGVSLEI